MQKDFSVEGLTATFEVAAYEDLSTLETQIIDEARILRYVLGALDEGDVAFDVGANVGLDALFMGQKVGPGGGVVAFEPESENVAALKRNVARNGLTRVIVVPLALGEGLLFGRGVFASLAAERAIGKGTPVPIAPGDLVVTERSHPIPRLIKIDVEGLESEVLDGLRTTLSHPQCRHVCCEIHLWPKPAEHPAEPFIETLRGFGFRRFEVVPCHKGLNIHLLADK
jgi:FkbM family methyltransferase